MPTDSLGELISEGTHLLARLPSDEAASVAEVVGRSGSPVARAPACPSCRVRTCEEAGGRSRSVCESTTGRGGSLQ